MRPDRAKVTQGVGFALPWAAISLGFQPTRLCISLMV